MEEIQSGKYFEIAYKLYRVNADGSETLVHEATEDDPDTAICGLTQGFVEALDEQLSGKKAGDSFDFVAEPDKAFGPYTEDYIYTVPREHLTVEDKFDPEMFTPGALVPLMTPDGFRIDGTVVELTEEAVVLDLNHPLAKDNVHYVGKVLTVRNPTEEELHPKGGCCGGCGDGCGGCGDENHGCGCGEGANHGCGGC